MDKRIEKHGDYAITSGRFLENMKRYVSEGDFERAFSLWIDLIEEDAKVFKEFLQKPEIQEKLATKFKELSREIVESKEVSANVSERIDSAVKMFHNLKSEMRQHQSVQDALNKLHDYALEYDEDHDQHHWKLFTS